MTPLYGKKFERKSTRDSAAGATFTPASATSIGAFVGKENFDGKETPARNAAIFF